MKKVRLRRRFVDDFLLYEVGFVLRMLHELVVVHRKLRDGLSVFGDHNDRQWMFDKHFGRSCVFIP